MKNIIKISTMKREPEVFSTIQGEGKNIGVPAVFVRLSLCNLHCHFCDTPYTWRWNTTNFPHRRSKRFSMKEELTDIDDEKLLKLTRKNAGKNIKTIVITGGEPLLQQKQLVNFVSKLKSFGFSIEVETNGTIKPIDEFAKHINQFNVSPKLENSGNEKSRRFVREVLEWYGENPKAIMKFVVKSKDDMKEIFSVVKTSKIPKERVFLMPEGITKSSIMRRTPDIIEIAKQNGYNFTTRLHVLAFGGAKRGV